MNKPIRMFKYKFCNAIHETQTWIDNQNRMRDTYTCIACGKNNLQIEDLISC